MLLSQKHLDRDFIESEVQRSAQALASAWQLGRPLTSVRSLLTEACYKSLNSEAHICQLKIKVFDLADCLGERTDRLEILGIFTLLEEHRGDYVLTGLKGSLAEAESSFLVFKWSEVSEVWLLDKISLPFEEREYLNFLLKTSVLAKAL